MDNEVEIALNTAKANAVVSSSMASNTDRQISEMTGIPEEVVRHFRIDDWVFSYSSDKMMAFSKTDPNGEANG